MQKEIDLPKESFTHIFVSFGIFVMPGALPKLYELLKPGGYIGITTWAELIWAEILPRCVSQMKDKPYCPSPTETEQKIYIGQDWGKVEFVASQLSDAGLQRVETMRHQFEGAWMWPKLFVDTMQLPLQIVASYWQEDKREEWLKELNEIMLRQLVADAGGEDKPVVTRFHANLAWAWKSGA